MILDPNGMPILQPNVDLAETATFNTAFAAIGNTLAPARIIAVADLDALAALSATDYPSRIVYVTELKANFQAQGGAWVQITPASFTSISARDTAYSKASGAFKVSGVRAKDTSSGITYQYLSSSWRAWESDWISASPGASSEGGSLGSASVAVRYKYVAGAIVITATATISNAGSATGALFIPLPVNAAAGATWILPGRETAATGVTLQGTVGDSSSRVSISKYDNTTIIATGRTVVVSGVYQPV